MPFYNNEYNGIRQSFFIRFCYQTPQQQAPSHHNHQQHQPPNLRSATRMRENDAFSTVSIHLINITRDCSTITTSPTLLRHISPYVREREYNTCGLHNKTRRSSNNSTSTYDDLTQLNTLIFPFLKCTFSTKQPFSFHSSILSAFYFRLA